MTTILVFHAPGDADGGNPWRAALTASGWDGRVVAPDLPGHGESAPPVGGHHELAQPAFDASRILAEAGLQGARPVVVGVGPNGWPAQLMALGGRASALVLVDGLGAPWLSPQEAVEAGRARLRALADDTAALASHSPPGLDPRLVHGPHSHGSRALAFRAAAAIGVPTLLIESPASPLPLHDRTDLLAAWAAPVDLREVAQPVPEVVAKIVAAWASSM